MAFAGQAFSLMNGESSNGFTVHPALKRPRTESIDCECQNGSEIPKFKRGKTFVLLPGSGHIYHTELWKPKGTSLYVPLTEDVLVNIKNTEQISFERGTYFVAGCNGEYQDSLSGWTTHFWRFDSKQRSLYISRSFLITQQQIYEAFRECLESM